MNLETKEKKKIFIAAQRSWQGDLTLQAKNKFKTEAEEHTSHAAAWLVKKHRDSILAKLDLEIQEVFKMVVQREDVLSCSEEVEIEDASKIEIDWLVDIKELDKIRKDDISVVLDDASVLFQTDNLFFSTNPAS